MESEEDMSDMVEKPVWGCRPVDFTIPEFSECEDVDGGAFEKVDCMAKR